jgi:XTP/dITP diphosphohydrolase
MTTKIKIVYSTTNPHKRAEIDETCKSISFPMPNGTFVLVGDIFEFDFRDGKPVEPLERDLEQMVRHKGTSAYKNLLVPCIVEHAGLIFEELSWRSYPANVGCPRS